MLHKLYSEDFHLFNLTNTFHDLFHHMYMSPDSHMKETGTRPPICTTPWQLTIWIAAYQPLKGWDSLVYYKKFAQFFLMSCQYFNSYDYRAGSFNTIHVLVMAFFSASEAQNRLLNISSWVIYKPDITE